MGDGPSGELLALVKRLGLATPEKVQSVLRRATRLARGLPLFDSVWIDALAQARILTPFQAEQINAGKGASLLVEDFVLYAPLRTAIDSAIHNIHRCESVCSLFDQVPTLFD